MRFSGTIRVLSTAVCSLLIGLAINEAQAQLAGSPYSSLGLGLRHSRELNYNTNMGGIGLSNANAWMLNNVNPALLPFNSFTNFEASLIGENRVVSSGEESLDGTDAGLGYLVFGFPLKPGKWTLSMGLMPYGLVNYNVQSIARLDEQNTDVAYNYEGSGGINQVNISTGLKIGKHLYAGIRGIYVFGSIIDETFARPSQTTQSGSSVGFLPTAFYQATRLSDITGQGGLMFSIPIGETSAFNLGTTYELGFNARTFRDEIIEIRRLEDFVITGDTISANLRGNTYIPARFGAGFSFVKSYKWTLGMDVFHQDWSAYRNFQNRNEGLGPSTRIMIGGDIIPDFASVGNYLKRITYGAGLFHETTPLVVNNTQIKDFGINFGVSLPVGSASLVTMGLTYGQMGSAQDGLIREQYLKLRFSITFNDRAYGWYRSQQKYN